nr:hypothetical protein [Tanacetum cinerariifolium]
ELAIIRWVIAARNVAILLEFDTFCNDYGIGDEYGLELPGLNDTIRDFPQGKIGANLQNFIRVPDHFDDVCAEKKLAANKEPLLEQTMDVVTQPSNAIFNLDIVTLNQAEEFVPCITFGVYKRLIFKGKKSGVLKKLMVKKSQLTILLPKSVMGPLYRSFIDHLATPGQFACLRSLPHQDVCDREDVAATRYITLLLEIRLRLKNAKLERRLGRRNAALKKIDAELVRLNKIINEKPSGEVARLRLGLKEAGKEVLRLMKQVERLKDKANKEKEQFELRNASLSGQVDGETEMAKEIDEEFAPMLRDTKATKDFLIGKAIADGMRQGLEARFVHSKGGTNINSIPAYNPNATEVFVDALKALSDVPLPLLDQAEACASQTSSYLEALLVMEVHEDGENEVGTSTHPASGSSSSVGGVINQSTIASSIPYAGDAGTAARDATPVDQVETVKTENVLIETALDDNAGETLSSTPDASRANPAILNSTNPILSR